MNTTTAIQTELAAARPGGAQVSVDVAKAEDAHWRSVVKAVSWRAVGTVDTMVISYLVTGKLKLAVSIGCVELFTKIGLYYVHERAWQRIPHGRAK